MTDPGRPGSLAYRAFGRYQRDARLILVISLITGAAISLYWIDFNLYLSSLGLPTSTIGLVATLASVAGALVAFPAATVSDRVGRRLVFAAGIGAALVGLVALILTDALPVIVAGAALFTAGSQVMQVVMAPYMTEHSDASHRNELFATQFAITSATSIVAAVIGGVVAGLIASTLGLDPAGPATYRVILVIMALLTAIGLATVALLSDDRPRAVLRGRLRRLGEPAAFPPDPRQRSRAWLRVTIRDRSLFVRLLLPGLLISIGAGQVIPFLNLFIEHKFGLSLTELNAAFALTSLGTVAAVLFQPRLARRYGQITSVVLVQGASIPFLLVLGFSPVLWTVILAMAVRNSLMNAGNPIFSAFAMEQVTPAERASMSASMNVLWQVGWVVGGLWYALLQGWLGVDAGYVVNFVTIIVLYTAGTVLLWTWFHAADRRAVVAAGRG